MRSRACLRRLLLTLGGSHFDVTAFRNQLMEPSLNSPANHSVLPPQDLTASLFNDIGWGVSISSCTAASCDNCVRLQSLARRVFLTSVHSDWVHVRRSLRQVSSCDGDSKRVLQGQGRSILCVGRVPRVGRDVQLLRQRGEEWLQCCSCFVCNEFSGHQSAAMRPHV